MAKTREIKKRIKAVGNIRRITKTMQMIATSKFAKCPAGAPWRASPTPPRSSQLVSELSASPVGDRVSHPLDLAGAGRRPPPREAKELTLIITSDRGLCGPYNGSVLRKAMAFFARTPRDPSRLDRAGRQEGRRLPEVQRRSPSPSSTSSSATSPPTSRSRRSPRTTSTASAPARSASVRVVYMKFITAGRQVPEVLQLLPSSPSRQARGQGRARRLPPRHESVPNYEFSPDAPTLLGELLPAAVKATLFQAFNDAVVSEHVARMVAMKSATDNAGKMGKPYTRKYNRARQAQITTELTEIISGGRPWAESLGADRYLLKPVPLDRLLEVTSELLDAE
jgi:F-type H+-transporting ATPase subunit gamma